MTLELSLDQTSGLIKFVQMWRK